MEKLKKISWVFVLLVILLLLALTLSFDNPVSRAVAKGTGKTVEAVNSIAQGSVWFIVGLVVLIVAAKFIAIPVVAVALLVVGLACIGLALWSWFGSSSKPDPVQLNANTR
jgi:hypothetical protein